MGKNIPKRPILISLFIFWAGFAFSQTTYYSRTAQANPKPWNDPDSWTLEPDGSEPAASDYPDQDDHVFILNGHTVEIDNVLDNDGPATSANAVLDPGGNIAPFAGSGDANFYHTGNITIEAGGTLTSTSAIRFMFRGSTYVFGNIVVGQDFINLGDLYFAPDATMDVGDDLILSGYSNTRIDITPFSNSESGDDVYIDHTEAFLCGLGFLDLGNATSSDPVINLNNGASTIQICDNLTISGCDDPPGPCSGTGMYNPLDPVLSTTIANLVYTENDVVPVDDGITISYPDGLFFTSATISITDNHEPLEDELTLANTPNISSSFNSGSGILTLTGYGTIATWQNILQSVTYENLSEAPTETIREVTFVITDGFGTSNPATATPDVRYIEVVAVNDPPDASISGSPGDLIYAEDSGPVPADPAIGIEDVDDINLIKAFITISPYFPAEDFLDFSDDFNITKESFSGGVLTLDGVTTIADYESALQTVTYENTSDNPNTTPRTVSFVVRDDEPSDSDPWERNITFTISNDIPDITSPATTQDVDEDTDLTFNATNSNLITVTDPDAGLNDIEVILAATNGIITVSASTATISNNGTAIVTLVGTVAEVNTSLDGLVYTPATDYSGAATLTIDSDDNGFTGSPGAQTDNEVVNINVIAVNDGPINTIPGVQTVDEDLVLTLNGANLISIADVDAGGNDITVTLTVSNGVLNLSTIAGLTSVTGNNSAVVQATGPLANINTALDGLTYQGTLNFNGTDNLEVSTNDNGEQGSGPAGTDVDDFDITVNPVNDGPINTIPGIQTVDEDLVLTLNGANLISIADVDAGGNDITVTLTVSNGVLNLSTIAGLTSVTGNNSAVVQATGPLANINTALDGLTYQGTLNFNGTDNLEVSTNDNGEQGSGPAGTDVDDFDITVNPVNDGPINTIPGVQTVDEDLVLTLNGANLISIADVDAGGNDITVTLTVSNGVLNLSTIAGLTSVTGNNTAVVMATGPLANINTALDGLTYQGTLNFNGTDNLEVSTNDNGEQGSGPAGTDVDDFDITVNPVNDGPINTIPGIQTVDEDLVLTLNGANLISIADVDAGGNDITVTLTVSNGVLNLSTIAGLTSVTGNNTAVVMATGPLANINTALDGLTYQGTLNFNGTDNLEVSTNDNGEQGSGPAGTDVDDFDITVNPVNDGPINTIPGVQTVDEDLVLTLNGANLISIADVDAGGNDITVTLTVSNGVLNLSTIAGLTSVTGNNTAVVMATGPLANINTALDGLTYQGTLNFNGTDNLEVSTNDNGEQGSGPAGTDVDDFDITVNPVNDGPINTIPGVQTVDEDLVLTLNGANLISIADVDAGGNDITVTLTVSNGVLNLSTIAGLTSVTGNNTAVVMATGPLANINTALDGLTYQGTLNFNGTDNLEVSTNDNGEQGSGPAGTDVDDFDITVNPINDGPINTIPGVQTVDEDLVLTLNGANLVSIADVDAGGNDITVTLTVSNGVLNLSTIAGLTSVTGNNTAVVMATGPLANINTALDGLTYQGTLNFNGTDNLEVSTNDNGEQGSGPAGTDVDDFDITVNPVNDGPINTIPGIQTVDEDLVLTLNGANLISIADVDAGGNDITVTLTVSNGVLNLSTIAGLTSVTGNNTAVVMATGPLANINTALDGLTYQGTLNFNGTDNLEVSTNDNGEQGSGPAGTDVDDFDITVNAVNDPPTITSMAPATATESIPYTYTPTVSDPDDANNGTELTWSLSGEPTGMAVSTIGIVTWTPGLGVTTSGLVTLTVQDGGEDGALLDSEDFTITVLPFNDPPSITSTAPTTATEGILYTYTATAADPDDANNGTDLTWSLTGAPSGMVVSTTGEINWTPDDPIVTPVSFTLTVEDGGEDGASPSTENITITVTGVNDKPTLALSLSTLAYTEGDGESILDTSIDVNDVDDTNLESASITVVTNYVQGEDVLFFSAQAGFTGSFDPATGSLLLSGSASLTDYESILQSVTYENVSSDPDLLPRTVNFSVNDGDNSSDVQSIQINITSLQPPVCTVTSSILDYTENDGPVPVDDAWTVTDPDNVNLASATVSISSNYVDGEDILAFTDQNGITGVFDSSTGMLSLIGSATLADYQSAIRTITYENQSEDPSTSQREITFIVNDGNEDSSPGIRTINVIAVNDIPEINGSSSDLQYVEGSGPVILDDQILVSDLDDTQMEEATISLGTTYVSGQDNLGFVDQLGITGTINASTGELHLTGSAAIADYITALSSLTYENTSTEPDLSARTVSFIINDGEDNSIAFTRNIMISGINEPPVFVDENGNEIDTVRFEILEDVPSLLCVETIDPEANNVNLASITSGTSNGTFDNGTTSDLCFTFTPAANYNGLIYGEITICDDGNPVSCGNAVVEITVLPVNDTPIAVDDEFIGMEDEVISGNVLENDIDPDGDTLNVSQYTDPENGTVVVQTNGNFSYTPDKDFAGQDFFTYRICDTADPSACDEAEVIIILEDVQDPVIAYQVLTPNNDDFNDSWVIDGIEQFPNNTVQIFDRWNSLVYRTQGYNNDDKIWNGQKNEGLSSGELPDGTYFYVISLGNGGDVLEGFIELKRE